MALKKKSFQQQTTYSLQIPLELQQRIDRIAQTAEKRDMVFDLDSTLVRAIKSEVTRAETALGIGARGRRRETSTGAQGDAPSSSVSFDQA